MDITKFSENPQETALMGVALMWALKQLWELVTGSFREQKKNMRELTKAVNELATAVKVLQSHIDERDDRHHAEIKEVKERLRTLELGRRTVS